MSQLAFSDALLRPDLPVPSGLTDARGAPAGKRFAVYRNNVTVSLIEALCEGFRATTKLLGEENMRNIAREYARAHPPSSPLMMLYGAEFPTFLEGFAPLARYPYLGDVARLEYAMRESYHAPDATAIAPEALASLPPEALGSARFMLAPAVRLIRSPWPVYGLWAFNMIEGAPKPEAAAQDVLIARTLYDPAPHVLGAGAATFIQALYAQNTLEEAARQAEAETQEFDLSAALGLLLNTQSIVEVTPEEAP